ncbi:hypothetical protein [Actinophytocola sediminis]
MSALDQVADSVRREWAGRSVVLVAEHVRGGILALAEELRRAGATVRAVVLNTRRPAALGVDHVWSCADHGLDLSPSRFEQWLCDPSPELLAWLDALDPARDWAVFGTTYAQLTDLGGRPARGRWRPAWAAWEDKTRVDELCRRVGVPSPPHEVTSAGDPALPAIAARVDAGRGVVLAADARDGATGSAHGLRWVRDHDELRTAVEDVRHTADRVRVAAFVPGVPCSVLAMVLPDGVAVFDPFEIVTLRVPASGRLVYGGTSTWWRPDASAVDEIREHTRALGAELARTAGYRGMFSVDGVLGESGFLMTELNPRHVSGLGLRAGWPEFPTRLLNRAVQDGDTHGVRHAELERAVRDTVRAVPSCSLWCPVPGLPDGAETSTTVRLAGGEHRVRHRAERAGAWLLGVDPVPAGGLLGPTLAALARRLGATDALVAFDDDSVRSRWPAQSSTSATEARG